MRLETRRRACWAALVLAACWTLPTIAQRPKPKLPKEIAGLPLVRAEGFDDPRLGIGALYRGETAPPHLTLYIYDLGLEEIPRDIHSETVRSQFQQARGDIETIDAVEVFELQSEGVATLGSEGSTLEAHEAIYVVEIGGRRMASYLHVLSTGRFFLKARYSQALPGDAPAPPLPEELRAALGDVFSSWMEPETGEPGEPDE
jgi:hypothetical protein